MATFIKDIAILMAKSGNNSSKMLISTDDYVSPFLNETHMLSIDCKNDQDYIKNSYIMNMPVKSLTVCDNMVKIYV